MVVRTATKGRQVKEEPLETVISIRFGKSYLRERIQNTEIRRQKRRDQILESAT
jgi:hypothetical protein